MIIARRFVRDQRRSFLWWAVALVAAIALTTSLYPSVRGQSGFEETFDDLPEVLTALAGISDEISVISAVGYLHARLFSLFMPFILVFFAVTMATRSIAGSEADGHLELLLANPVSRRRVFVERGLAVVALTVAMAAIGFVATVALSAPFGLLDDVEVGRIAQAVAAGLCLALIHASISAAVGGATGSRSGAQAVAATSAVGGFLLNGVIEVTDGVSFLGFVTPWHWYADRIILLDGVSFQGTLVPVALAGVFATIGALRFGVRDLK